MPVYTIVDGIQGMEGMGPIYGTPSNLNVIVAGPDPVAVDIILCKLIQIPYWPGYLQNAIACKLGEHSEAKIKIIGEIKPKEIAKPRTIIAQIITILCKNHIVLSQLVDQINAPESTKKSLPSLTEVPQ